VTDKRSVDAVADRVVDELGRADVLRTSPKRSSTGWSD
jgi:hypothetical protein